MATIGQGMDQRTADLRVVLHQEEFGHRVTVQRGDRRRDQAALR
jgi:hypothetical protein